MIAQIKVADRDETTQRFRSLGLSLEQEFWRRVKIGSLDDCWLWIGTIYSHGYGVLKYHGKRYGAHRLNPPCCNPSHLFLGTIKDNQLDSVSKGRHSHGERHPDSKFSEGEMLKRSEDYTLEELLRIKDVSFDTIWNIVNRKTWKHL